MHIDMVHDDACVRGNANRGRSVEWRGWRGSNASYTLRSPATASDQGELAAARMGHRVVVRLMLLPTDAMPIIF